MRGFLRSLKAAASGVFCSLCSERNLRIHLVFCLYVWYFSGFYPLAQGEQLLLVLLCAAVLALELVNTAIERLGDGLMQKSKEADAQVGRAKDAAAGAVLILAIASLVIGWQLFFDRAVLAEIVAFHSSAPLRGVMLILSLIPALLFIKGPKKGEKDEQL